MGHLIPTKVHEFKIPVLHYNIRYNVKVMIKISLYIFKCFEKVLCIKGTLKVSMYCCFENVFNMLLYPFTYLYVRPSVRNS